MKSTLLLTALLLSACTTGPAYTYGPASYATPPNMAPTYEPIPIPLPAVTAIPLPAPGQAGPPALGPLDDPFARMPPATDPFAAAPRLEPEPQAEPPPTEPAPTEPPPPSDPVTDLLLAPPSQRDTAPAVVKKPTPPEANPLMGFRPMRGETAPIP